jgi:uncharacterized protein (DUF4415 family)
MLYEWDETKRRKNIAIHGVDFSTVESFEWESAVIRQDTRKDYGETRYAALGNDRRPVALRVFHGSRQQFTYHQLEKGQRERGKNMARKVIPPSRAENERINRGIAADPDTLEWTTEEFAKARPASEVLPRGLFETAVKRRKGQRGPQKAPVKKAITLRIDPDILARYKATGPGWQSRMNEALRRSLETA